MDVPPGVKRDLFCREMQFKKMCTLILLLCSILIQYLQCWSVGLVVGATISRPLVINIVQDVGEPVGGSI